jgi:hypothetical protein
VRHIACCCFGVAQVIVNEKWSVEESKDHTWAMRLVCDSNFSSFRMDLISVLW